MGLKDKDVEWKDISVNYDLDSLDEWTPSIEMPGHGTLDPSYDVTYGDIGTADMFEEELKKKYPALQDAWEHYQNVKQLCETREKEEDDS